MIFNRFNYLIYAFPEIALSGAIIFAYIYFPKFLIEYHNLSPALIGVSLLLIKSFDCALSPFAGSYINNYKRRGRKFADLIKVLSPALSIAIFLLITLPGPEFLSKDFICLLYSVIFIILWTSYSITYQALGLSIKISKSESLNLFSVRDAATVAGTILTSGILAIASGFSLNELYQSILVAICLAVILYFSSLLLVKHVAEGSESGKLNHISEPWFGALQNRNFNILSLYYFLTGFGSALSGSLILIYVRYVLNSAHANLYVFIFFLISFFSIPLWNRLARNRNRLSTLIAAMLLTTISFGGVLFLESGDESLYLGLISLSALGIGGCLIIPSAMQSDICKNELLKSEVPKEALYTGLWSMIKKMSAALATGIAFILLDFTEFNINASPLDGAANIITLLYAGVPFVCYIGAILLFLFYPITEDKFINRENIC
jgi:GPH family glycoside/pentoside/hexuronide:cation symporter